MLLVADFNSREYFAESCQKLIFEDVVELGSTFGEGVEEGVEDRLSEGVEILFEKDIIFLFVCNRQEKSNIVFGDPLFELSFRVLISALMKELANGKPETIRNQSLIFCKFKYLVHFSMMLLFEPSLGQLYFTSGATTA